MKVIKTDNFDRDWVDDVLIAGPGLCKKEAEKIADKNNAETTDPEAWYMAVEDDYILKEFKP